MRQFSGEEMYLCFKCNKSLCRFCLHEDEIDTFYCRFCLDPIPAVEAAQHQNQCSRYLECPLCVSIIQIAISAGREKFYYYVCNFCKWDTVSVNLKAKSVHELLLKYTLYKGKYKISPQQDMFNRILDVLRFNLNEQLEQEKQEMRIRNKKQIPRTSFFAAKGLKKGGRKFKLADLEAIQEEKKMILA